MTAGTTLTVVCANTGQPGRCAATPRLMPMQVPLSTALAWALGLAALDAGAQGLARMQPGEPSQAPVLTQESASPPQTIGPPESVNPPAPATPHSRATSGPPEVALDTVSVTGRRLPLSAFPGAVDVINGDALRDGQRRVHLSESIGRVPGITVRDRGNLAQDLQVQSRGFGAQSTFGIRGIRLVADGVPLSAADGQGQAAGFPLDNLDRIEVLRGPLALQYGNAAGGAIVGHTDLDDEEGVALDAWVDQHAQRVAGRWDGGAPRAGWRWRLAGSHHQTDGVRPHSAAERTQAVGNAEWRPDASQRLRLSVNSLGQPWTDDPLGLTRAQWEADPHGGAPAASLFDTRKRIANHQLGLRWEHESTTGRAGWLAGYGVVRHVEQFLAIPQGAQAAPTSAGGVVALDRREGGLEGGRRWSWGRGSLAAGIELTQLSEARRGYENFIGTSLGVRGRLRRDEDNRVTMQSAFLLGEWALDPRWHALAGLRHARSQFDSRDHYQGPGNGDDSGRVRYAENAASLGLARRHARGEVFASVGRGFETPTVTELSYRPDGSGGLNLELRPAHSASIEIGARWRSAGQRVGWTAYRIDGRDGIVAATSTGGRATFTNAGATRREGMELGIDGGWGSRWRYTLAANWLRARFSEAFSYRVFSDGAMQTRRVAAGNRMPGIARAEVFTEIGWRSPDGRVDVAMEGRASERVFVDDRNSDAAPGHALMAIRLALRSRDGRWNAFARIDNLLDRDHVGSVIVNEGNGRFFEPGSVRALTLGWGWRSP